MIDPSHSPAAALVQPAPPDIDDATAAGIALEGWGVSGRARALGSHQDRNFLIEPGAGPRFLLKIANPSVSAPELEAQSAAAEAIGAAGVRAPRALSFADGTTARPVVVEDPPSKRWLLWTLVAVAVLAISGIVALLVANADKAPAPVTVPDVVSMEQELARTTIEEAGLTFNPTQEASVLVPKGSVIKTDPEAGASVATGSSVTVVISSGADAVVLDDLTNLSRDQAISWLTERDFVLGNITVTTKDSPDVEKDKVAETDPAAGTSLNPTTDKVTIYLSTGVVQLPDFVGTATPYDTAKAALDELGLTVIPAEKESVDAPPGTVILQSPAPGPVKQRSTVTLTKAVAPTVETVTVPSGLIGMTCTNALNALAGVNLNGSCVQSDGTQAAGQWVVTSATPGSGTTAAVGDTVTLVAQAAGPSPTPTPTP